MRFIYAELNGKRVGYTDRTEFIIQVGRGRGAYRTKNVIRGNIGIAFIQYNSYSSCGGFKKRLIMAGSSKSVLARSISKKAINV